MSKKNIALVLLLLVMGAIYIFYFTDAFREPTIEISTRIRPQIAPKQRRSSRSGVAPAPVAPVGNSISFALNSKYKLTSVKVIEENDSKTNKYPHSLWHLISESNSVPTKTIFYGAPIGGMKPEYANTKPEPLQTNVSYVLQIEAGDLKGQATFQVR
jgi:hypothetical protein